MIKNLIVSIYSIVPSSLRQRIGQSKLLRPLRNSLLRSNGSYNETQVVVKREYSGYVVAFNFFASIKVASQAKNRGIENTILHNSMRLMKEFNSKRNDAVVFDIGANFGYLSLVWANSIAKNGKVIAFEPNPNVFKSFKKSISSNNLESIIQLNNKAVGIREGEIELYLNSTTSNTLNLDGANKNGISIGMISIDSFTQNHNIEKCDLIKIDVDGIELDILRGAQNFIKKCRPIFIVETNSDQRIIEFFNENAYEVLDMKLNIFKSDDDLPLNIFCVPKTNRR